MGCFYVLANMGMPMPGGGGSNSAPYPSNTPYPNAGGYPPPTSYPQFSGKTVSLGYWYCSFEKFI